ncbi:hypothetical protein [Streptodolium elevatio]|uniref:Uncharacterized protein n=1 Tax=Streptodolium elevatio TaxID=3157996 RepID=A0ABV3D8E5_9ACTN
MTDDITRAADKLAKLRAQADKLAAPLADAEAALLAAEVAEAARRAEHTAEYSRNVVRTYRQRADDTVESGDKALGRFRELLAAEPWFAAFVEYRAARYKKGVIHTAAQSAQRVLGEEVTVSDVRWYEPPLLDMVVRLAEDQASAIAADYAEHLDAERNAYVEGTV